MSIVEDNYGSRTLSAIGRRRFSELEQVCVAHLRGKIEELSLRDDTIDVEDFVKLIVLFVMVSLFFKTSGIIFLGTFSLH